MEYMSQTSSHLSDGVNNHGPDTEACTCCRALAMSEVWCLQMYALAIVPVHVSAGNEQSSGNTCPYGRA